MPHPPQRTPNRQRQPSALLKLPLKLLKGTLRWFITKPSRLITILLLAFWLAIVWSNFFFKGKFIFEGNILAQQMSFTYAGDSDKRFLDNIRSIQNLDLEGSQPQPLVLKGKFSSPDPTLNAQLSQRDRLTLQFPYPKSRFIVKPTKSNPASLDLLEVNLSPASQVNQLTYTPSQLSFCLQSASQPSSACLFSDTQSDSTPVGTLQLS